MFCFQCEQTRLRKGCTTIGVCGKTAEVAALQDMLVHVVMGMSMYSHAAKKVGAEIPKEIYDFSFSALFRFVKFFISKPNPHYKYKDYDMSCKNNLIL